MEKESTTTSSDRRSSPRKEPERHDGSDVASECLQANRFSKGFWYPKKGDRDGRRGRRCGIASQTLCPGESPMCPPCTGKRAHWWRQSRRGWFSQSDIDTLVTKELHQPPPMGAPLPVSPQDGMRRKPWRRWRRRASGLADWPENGTDAARFLGSSAIALAVLAQRTGTTMTDAGGIDNAQTAIVFWSSFLGIQGETSRTA